MISRQASQSPLHMAILPVPENLGVIIETARFHLKRVLKKTRTHRPANLIRLMLSLPGQL
jgi:hypothetical protein